MRRAGFPEERARTGASFAPLAKPQLGTGFWLAALDEKQQSRFAWNVMKERPSRAF